MANVQVLNTADLLPKDPLVLKIDGVDYVKVEPSVTDTLQTLRDLDHIAKAGSLLEELEFVIKVIRRAFPTLDEDTLGGWPSSIIDAIFTIARDGGKAEVATEDAEGNAQPAN